MTIHNSHPFLPPEEDRNPLRRLRGRRLVGPEVDFERMQPVGFGGTGPAAQIAAEGAVQVAGVDTEPQGAHGMRQFGVLESEIVHGGHAFRRCPV